MDNNNVKEIIASRLKEIRKSKGMPQADVARILGVNVMTISQWENARRTIPSDNLAKFCKLFQCDPGYLLGLSKTDLSKELELEKKYISHQQELLNKKIKKIKKIQKALLQLTNLVGSIQE